MRAERASIGGAEFVRLSREAANAEVVQSKVVLSQAFTAWEPSIPILLGVQSRSKTWGWGGGQYDAIILTLKVSIRKLELILTVDRN